MLKNKLTTSLILGLLMLFGVVIPAKASTVLAIQTLPSYINTRDFKLSCTSDASSVTFSVSKNGGSPVNFATLNPTATPCQVQVTPAQIDEEATYTFAVIDGSLLRSTSTIFDNSGPSSVSGYYKDGLSDGYRLHYHTPSDSDFDKVIIYRGDTPDFSADSSHEIATVNSSPNSDMTYEDHSGSGKYYNIRALDHAGNSSALVGDGGGTVTIVTTGTPSSTGGNVTIFPKEAGAGSVLGTEATASPTPELGSPQPDQGGVVNQINQFANQTPNPIKWILTHKKISIGIALILFGIAYYLYRMSKKNK